MSRPQPGQRSSLLAQGRLKLSELFPLMSRQRAPLSSAFFGPIILTLALVVVLVNALNDDALTNNEVLFVIRAMEVWLAVAGLTFFHVLCGGIRPWWWSAGGFVCAAGLTFLERRFSYPFLGSLDRLMPNFDGTSVAARFFNALLNTAVPEEVFKAIPIFVVILLGLRRSRLAGGRPALTPLEGALLGAACGAGFTLIETDQYVYGHLHPEAGLSREQIELLLAQTPAALVPDAAGAFLQVLFRMVGQVSMHAAWTGIAGYYLGLALRIPRHAKRLAGGGILLAATMHALWNTGFTSQLTLWLVAALSYALFASAVLKGQQFASRSPTAGKPAPDHRREPTPKPTREPTREAPRDPSPAAAVVAVSAAAAAPTGRSVGLRVGSQLIALRPGDTVQARQLPGSDYTRADEIVGEVVENPTDPQVWGLRNRSTVVWHAVVRPGDERQIQPGHSVRLASGVTLRIGAVTITVE